MRDGNFAKHPLTHPGWFTFGPNSRKTTPRVCGFAAFFFIARLPLLAVTQGGASRAIPLLSQTTPPILQIPFSSTPAGGSGVFVLRNLAAVLRGIFAKP